jgi:hypothetical protein
MTLKVQKIFLNLHAQKIEQPDASAIVDRRDLYPLPLTEIGGYEFRGHKNACRRTHLPLDIVEIYPPLPVSAVLLNPGARGQRFGRDFFMRTSP